MARTADVVHAEPVWRDKSNFIIGAPLPEGRSEQLWVRQIGDCEFELCCIPFFLYDVALGDVVRTGVDYEMSGVVRSSGRYVFRVWFGESFQPRDEIAAELQALGVLIEWSSRNLLAVDAVDVEQAQVVADFLAERQAAGHLVYETGRS